MKARCLTLVMMGALGLGPGAHSSTAQTVRTPAPSTIIDRACEAAGGSAALRSIPLLRIAIAGSEVTTAGETTASRQRITIVPPGPIPGRIEYVGAKVVAADDGTGGWALVGGKLDVRPSTSYMVRRSITTKLFPILLPFSLRWEGINVTHVSATDLDGRPVWRLTLIFAKSFFVTPQIATVWTVDIDRATNTVLRAQSPYTDLGKDIVADGMRFSWLKPIKVGAVTLPSEQHVVGLDQKGLERPHSRIDRISYEILPAGEADAMFANPVPPAQRPKIERPASPPPGSSH